jgi:hypothetical protein
MTGLNVAFTIPGDSFVPDKIDNYLTASHPDFPPGTARTFFTSRVRAWQRERQ